MKQEKQHKESSKKSQQSPKEPLTIKLTRQERKDLIDDMLFQSLDYYNAEDVVKELAECYKKGLPKGFTPYNEWKQHDLILRHMQVHDAVELGELVRNMEMFTTTAGRAIKLAHAYKEYLP